MIIDDNFLSSRNKDYIDQVILSNNFPYYLQLAFLEEGKKEQSILCHCVLKREEDRLPGEFWNSDHYQYYIDILKNFVEKHNIECNEILRCSVNLTFKSFQESCDVHDDQPFPHKQLLIYCNDCDIEATTTVLGDKTQVISPKKYRGVCFDSAPHYMTYPKEGHRIVIVYNFR